jgi:hypothetical protein
MHHLNGLINRGQTILDRVFDAPDSLSWKTAASLSLLKVLGPVHYYTKNFRRLTSENSPLGLLAGLGILIAAREESLKAVA